jgi:glyoxylase I family protein
MSDRRPFEVLGLDHVVLRVADLSASLRFYCEVLGCREVRRLDALGLVQLRCGSCLIDLVELSSPLGKAGGAGAREEGRNMDHFAISISPLLPAELAGYLEAAGVEPGAVSTRYGAKGNGPSMYIRDPDGNVVELKGPPEDVED